MRVTSEDWKNGWFGVDIELSLINIDHLIEMLKMLKEHPDQHFHISSDFKGTGGVGQLTFSIQSHDSVDNTEMSSRAYLPGEKIPDRLNKIEMAALSWVSMDYETIRSIIENISRDIGTRIEPHELYRILCSLRQKGLIESFSFSVQCHDYVPEAPNGTSTELEKYWYITNKGKSLLK
jgi:hypothetical protein